MRKFFCILCLMILNTVLPARAEVQWTYPIAADILFDREELLVLTTPKTLLKSDFVPAGLETIRVRSTVRGMQLRHDAHEQLKNMFQQAEKEGVTLYVKSAYRSYQTQNTMYQNRLAKVGKDDGVVAVPGSSDHQTGLAVDILNFEWTQQDGMRPEFSRTKEAQWMKEHCAKFGFILRYLEDKTDITGIIFEPWHFRYVGKEVAAYMMQKNLSLEEFTEEYQAAIADFEKRGGDFKAYVKSLTELPPPLVLEGEQEGEEEVSLFYKAPK